jgi:hypothetical protein
MLHSDAGRQGRANEETVLIRFSQLEFPHSLGPQLTFVCDELKVCVGFQAGVLGVSIRSVFAAKTSLWLRGKGGYIINVNLRDSVIQT